MSNTPEELRLWRLAAKQGLQLTIDSRGYRLAEPGTGGRPVAEALTLEDVDRILNDPTAARGRLEGIDHALALEVVERMICLAGELAGGPPERLASTLGVFLADARLLAGVVGDTHGRTDHEMIAALILACRHPEP